MKNLNQYIKESLLDDENELLDRADDVAITNMLNDPKSEFRQYVIFDGVVKSIKYYDGVLSVDANQMIFTKKFEDKKIKLSDFCPGIKILKCNGGIFFNMRKITAENICENIEANRMFPPTIFHYIELLEGINFNCSKYFGLNAKVVKDCNIKSEGVRLNSRVSKFENVKIDCDKFEYYDTFLTEDGIFADAFNSMLDPNYSFIIHDIKKGEDVEFKPNKLKKIVAKAKNTKRYRGLDATPLAKNPDLYKFKKGKNGKTLLKELGLDKLNSNHIVFCNNDFDFILSDDPKRPRPFRLFAR